MAINYNIVPSFAPPDATFACTNSDIIRTAVNGSTTYIAASAGSTINFYRSNLDTQTGTSNAPVATFAMPGAPASLAFYYNGANSIIVATYYLGNAPQLWRFNADTVSGAQSVTATFSQYNYVTDVRLYLNGSQMYVFLANFFFNSASLYRINPATVSGAQSTPDATFSAPNYTSKVDFFYNGTNSLLFVNSSAQTTKYVQMFRFDPATVSGTVSSAVVTFPNTEIVQTGDIIYSQLSSTEGYLILAGGGTNNVIFYRFNPSTITNSSQAASYTFLGNPAFITFFLNGPNSYLIAPYNNSIYFYRFNPTTIAANTSTPTFTVAVNSPARQAFNFVSNTAYLLTTGDSLIKLFRGDLNAQSLLLALTQATSINTNSPVKKTTTTPLTLTSAVDYFSLALLLRAGSLLVATGIGTLVYGYAITVVSDTTLTINENFVYSGSTATVSGDYRLTLGASKTLKLGTKGTYPDSWTIPSTGTIALTANTTITSGMILSAGTSIVSADGGSYTFTIPFADPGLVLGTGITLISPQPTLTFTNLPSGVEARITQGAYTLAYTANITSGSFSYVYNYTANEKIQYNFTIPGYEQIRESLILSNSNQTIPLSFQPDPSYV